MSNVSAWYTMRRVLSYYFQKPSVALRKSSMKQKPSLQLMNSVSILSFSFHSRTL